MLSKKTRIPRGLPGDRQLMTCNSIFTVSIARSGRSCPGVDVCVRVGVIDPVPVGVTLGGGITVRVPVGVKVTVGGGVGVSVVVATMKVGVKVRNGVAVGGVPVCVITGVGLIAVGVIVVGVIGGPPAGF